jgi:hypothetical protein
MNEALKRTPDVDHELSRELLIKELEVAKTLTRLRDKKAALEALTAEVEDIAEVSESLKFDIQSLDGLPLSKQHSIVNWRLNILTSWLTGNKLAAFEFQKIVNELLSNTGIN